MIKTETKLKAAGQEVAIPGKNFRGSGGREERDVPDHSSEIET